MRDADDIGSAHNAAHSGGSRSAGCIRAVREALCTGSARDVRQVKAGCAKSRARGVFLRLLAFELRRYPTPVRMSLACAALVAMVLLARGNLLQQAAVASAQAAGDTDAGSVSLTAFDMLYLAFNSQLITGVMLPAVCGMLCADLVARDRMDGMRAMIACEVRSAAVYVAAKLAVAAVVSVLFVLTFSLACTIASGLLLGLPVSLAPPTWLASAGPADSMWGQYGLIPSTWNYPVLMAGLVACVCVLEAVLAWVAMALCATMRTPGVALLVPAACYVFASQVESLLTSLGILLGIDSLTTTVGWVTDRLCLVNYRLGAALFQTSAGGAYRGAMAVGADVSTHEYPINSWASLAAITAVLACVSVGWLLVRERRVAVRGHRG